MASRKSPDEGRIYCEECRHFVGYEVLENGDRVILCTRCSGECAFCHCTLGEKCFESLKVKYVPKGLHPDCGKEKGK